MRAWTLGLVLGLAMVVAAFGWTWLAADPGYVMVRVRGYSVETTLAFALIALLFAWASLSLLMRLMRLPLRLWYRRARRRSRERLANGLIALAEGRYARAERELARATQYRELRAPALLAAARAAIAQGEAARADAALVEAMETAPAAALALRARLKREQGASGEAYQLLVADSRANTLAPAGWVEFIDAALATGETDAAHAALVPLARAQALPPARYDAIESRVLSAVLDAQPSADALHALWGSLSKSQRRRAETLAAYARRSAAFGQSLPAMSEIEAFLRKDWADAVVLAYADLGDTDAPARLRTAEGWLRTHPNDVALLTAIGRLCVASGLWGKAHEILERALAIGETVPAWEALGDGCRGEGDAENAVGCYRNALRLQRGEPTEPLPGRGARLPLDTSALVLEERSEHGVPRLPNAVR